MSLAQSMMKKMELDWVVINYRSDYGKEIIIVAPHSDGSVPTEDVLRRHIPFKFLFFLKLLHLRTPIVVRGLITQDEIDAEHRAFEMMWAAYN